jgi:hypothetical protein
VSLAERLDWAIGRETTLSKSAKEWATGKNALAFSCNWKASSSHDQPEKQHCHTIDYR